MHPDPVVQAAVVGGIFTLLIAWISRPARGTHKRVKRIEEQFQNNGGSTAKDQLDRIERSQQHLVGRFDQHLAESSADKAAAHREAVEMWAAIKAVAKATPPEGEDHP